MGGRDYIAALVAKAREAGSTEWADGLEKVAGESTDRTLDEAVATDHAQRLRNGELFSAVAERRVEPDALGAISRLLAVVERADWRWAARSLGWRVGREIVRADALSPADFGPALPIGFGLQTGINEAGGVLGDDEAAVAVAGGVDVTTITDHGDDGAILRRVRRVGPGDVRGRVRSTLPEMWAMTESRVHPQNGLDHTAVFVFGRKSTGGEFWALSKNIVRAGAARAPSMPQDDAVIREHWGYALAGEYSWHVDIGWPGGMRVSLGTDAEGAREMLRGRDVAPGERRKALVHWVAAHARKNRKSDDISWVRAHMRGEENAFWAGIPVVVRPSAYDVRRLGMGVAP